jgi:DNA mismatch repair protein MutL
LLEKVAEGELEPQETTATEHALHTVLDMMACKAAVKAGDPLPAAQQRALMAERAAVARSSNCPHGRPTTIRVTRAELERRFGRK